MRLRERERGRPELHKLLRMYSTNGPQFDLSMLASFFRPTETMKMSFFILVSYQDGEVLLETGNTKNEMPPRPMMSIDNQWYSICGDGFVDNAVGATLFCEKLGFTGGFGINKKAKRNSPAIYKAVHVGKCQYSDTQLMGCKGGGNDYKITEEKECANIDYTIECFQGSSY